MKNKFMQFLQKEDNAELYIYGDIVDYKWYENDVTSNDIKEAISKLNGQTLNVHINSYGGDVFTGIAIFNMLKSYEGQVNVYVDSCACSIASVIAMAGNKVLMPKNTLMMIHNAWTFAIGNSEELRKTADDLDVIMNASIESYMSRIKITREELVKLLDAETWLTAEECVEKGFADEVLPINESEGVSQSTTLFKLVEKIRELEKPLNEKISLVEEKTEEVEVEPSATADVENIETEVDEETEENLTEEKNLKETILEKMKGMI